jgi:hypothetical protein
MTYTEDRAQQDRCHFFAYPLSSETGSTNTPSLKIFPYASIVPYALTVVVLVYTEYGPGKSQKRLAIVTLALL